MKQNNKVNQLRVIGLTGGIGAGKTTMAQLIKDTFPVEVIFTDEVAREQMEIGQPSYLAVIKEFGTSFLNDDQSINRAKLAELIFCREDRVKKINELTHPNVKTEVLKRITTYQKDEKLWAVIIESALLFDAHFETFCDEVWYVDAPKKQRVERLIRSRGYTKEKAESIISQQKMEDYAKEQSDYIINNADGEDSKDILDKLMEKMENSIIQYRKKSI